MIFLCFMGMGTSCYFISMRKGAFMSVPFHSE